VRLDQLVPALVAIRRSRELRQADVADSLGLAQPTISQFEADRQSPRLDTVIKYANAIGARVTVLVEQLPDPTNGPPLQPPLDL